MNVLDLFSGIGGFSLGLERAGMRTVGFCEVDPYCRAVLAKRWPGVPIYGDIRELHLPQGFAEMLCGGFPCQDISTAGDGAGLAGLRSGLWSQYHRLIEEVRPHWALIENVSALRSRGLDQILGQLASVGYDAEWYCIPACAVGARHRRDRIWIVAYPQRDELREQSRGSSGTRRAGSLPAPFDGETRSVADTHLEGQYERGKPDLRSVQPRLEASLRHNLGRLREALADAGRGGHQGPGTSGTARSSAPDSARKAADKPGDGCVGRIWEIEPDVGRVADGVPSRVDRLRALGNAVVPQIPEIIGRAILEWAGAMTPSANGEPQS